MLPNELKTRLTTPNQSINKTLNTTGPFHYQQPTYAVPLCPLPRRVRMPLCDTKSLPSEQGPRGSDVTLPNLFSCNGCAPVWCSGEHVNEHHFRSASVPRCVRRVSWSEASVVSRYHAKCHGADLWDLNRVTVEF